MLDVIDWHIGDLRYERAIVLARRVFEREPREDLLRRAHRRTLNAHRLGGATREVLPRVRALCADGVPSWLGWEIYWGMRAIDHGLAAEGAASEAARTEGVTRTLWLIRAAAQRERLGAPEALDEVRAECGESANAWVWAALSYGFNEVERWEEANAAARRAVELDDTVEDALSAMEEAFTREGDVAAAIGCARRLAELHPYEHVGPERLGALLARQLEVEEALRCSHRAVDAAPFCHNAHWSRALALFAADDLEGARRHASRSLAIHEPAGEDAANDCLMIRYAVDREADRLEACFVKLYERQPEGLFAAFEAKLRAVARRGE